MDQKNLPIDVGELVEAREVERRLGRPHASFREPVLRGDVRAWDPETDKPTKKCLVTTRLSWEDARQWHEKTPLRKKAKPEPAKRSPAKPTENERVELAATLPSGETVRFEISLASYSRLIGSVMLGGAEC